MISALIRNLLNTYLGYYVDNLNNEQLEFGILAGRVDLTDLNLRKDILSKSGLPFTITKGEIGRVYMEIPLSQIFSGNYVINMQDIEIECELNDDIEFDSSQHIINLDLMEQTHLMMAHGKYRFMIGSFITQIINKIEIQLHNIHIAIKGLFTIDVDCISCTNKKSSNNAIQLDISGFRVYKESVLTVIQPCNALIVLYYDKSPFPLGEEESRFKLEAQLKEIRVGVNHDLINSLMDFTQQYKLCANRIRFKKWRPEKPIKDDPRAWWVAVVKALKDDMRNKRVGDMNKDMLEYIAMYQQMLERGTYANETLKKKFESTHSFEEISNLRNLAFETYRKSTGRQKNIEKERTTTWQNRIGSFFTMFKVSKDDSTEEAEELNNQLVEILNKIKDDVTVLKRDHIFLKGRFKMEQFSLVIHDNDSHEDLFCFNVDDISLAVQVEPRNEAFRVSGHMRSFELNGSDKSKIAFSLNESDFDPNFASFSFDVLPKNSSSDYRCHAKLMPLRFVYSSDLSAAISRLVNSKLTSLSQTHYYKEIFIKNFTRLQMAAKQNLWQLCYEFVESDARLKNKRWDVDLAINAPQLLIQDDFENILLIVFGQLQVQNVWNSVDFKTPPEYPSEAQMVAPKEFSCSDFKDSIYEGYQVDLTGFSVLAGDEGSDWGKQIAEGFGSLHVLDRVNLSFIVKRRIISIVDESWPKILIEGNLEEIMLHLDDKKLCIIKNCLQQISVSPPRSVDIKLSSEFMAKEFEGNLMKWTFTVSRVGVELLTTKPIASMMLGNITTQMVCAAKTYKIDFTLMSLDIVDCMTSRNWMVSSHRELSHGHHEFEDALSTNDCPLISISLQVSQNVSAKCAFNNLFVVGRMDCWRELLQIFKRLTVPSIAKDNMTLPSVEISATFNKITLILPSEDDVITILLHNADAEMTANGVDVAIDSYLSHIQLLYSDGFVVAEIGCGDDWETCKAIRCSFKSCPTQKDIDIKIASIRYLHCPKFVDNLMKYHSMIAGGMSETSRPENMFDRVNLYISIQSPIILIELSSPSNYFSVHLGRIRFKTGSFLHGEIGPSKNLLNVKDYLIINSRINPIAHVMVKDLCLYHLISSSPDVVQKYFNPSTFSNNSLILEKSKFEICVLSLSSTQTQVDPSDELYHQHVSQKIVLNINMFESLVFNFNKNTLEMLISCLTGMSSSGNKPSACYRITNDDKFGIARTMTLTYFILAFDICRFQFNLFDGRSNSEFVRISLDDISGLLIPVASCLYGFKAHLGVINIIDQREMSGSHGDVLLTSCLSSDSAARSSPELSKRYENHFVEIELVSYYLWGRTNNIYNNLYLRLHSLSVVLNLDSWIFLVDLLNIPSLASGGPSVKVSSFTTERIFSVSAGRIVFGLRKPEYMLAEIIMDSFILEGVDDANQRLMDFHVGCFNIVDRSNFSGEYKDKLVAWEDHHSNIRLTTLKHDSREYDVHVKLEMSSIKIIYVHCFFMDMVSFFDHFVQIKSFLNLNRDTPETTVVFPQDAPTRTKLEVDAGAPLIFLPTSWEGDELLACDFGKLRLRNNFEFVPLRGKPTGQTLLEIAAANGVALVDVIDLDLTDIIIFAARRRSRSDCVYSRHEVEFDDFVLERHGPPIMAEKCQLNLNIRRNLDGRNHELADWTVKGILSSVEFHVTPQQYKLVCRIMSSNLGQQFDFSVPDWLMTNFDLASKSDGHRTSCIGKSLDLSLSNIVVNLYSDEDDNKLAKFDLIKSLLVYKKYSDLRTEMNLYSYEIDAFDGRSESRNVHPHMLSPSVEGKSDTIQFEINYSAFKQENSLKLLFKSMRILGILDLIMDLVNFFRGPSADNPAEESYSPHTKHNFTFMLSLADTEFIFLENSSLADSCALVVKGDMMFKKQDYNMEQPLFCDLQNIELFSCVINNMKETTLSIIDPFKLSLDFNRPLLTSKSEYSFRRIMRNINLDVVCGDLTLSISYNDMSLVLALFESIPVSIGDVFSGKQTEEESLFQLIRNVNFFCDGLSLLLIDDYLDINIPLLEFCLRKWNSSFVVGNDVDGVTTMDIFGVYYNRFLSSWEYFIEPLKLRTSHLYGVTPEGKVAVKVEIEGDIPLNVNITKAMMDLYQITLSRVRERSIRPYKYRTVFTPYVIRNDLGMPIYFQVLTATNNCNITIDGDVIFDEVSPWVEVLPGDSADFTTDHPGKKRHANMHEFQIRRIHIRVGSSQLLKPIPIDTSGVFLRDIVSDSLNGRISATVSQEGSKKLILITSTLVIANNLKMSIEVIIDGLNMMVSQQSRGIIIPTGEVYHVPLNFVNSNMSLKVLTHGMLRFYDIPFCWFNVEGNDSIYCTMNCKTTNGHYFKYIVSLINLGYPRQIPFDKQKRKDPVAGHLLGIYPFIVVCNNTLLPIIFNYNDGRQFHRVIEPNDDIHLHSVNSPPLSFGFVYAGFKSSDELTVDQNTTSYNSPLSMYDRNSNCLVLNVSIHKYLRGFVEILVTSPYYVLNSTGIPLLFVDVEADTAGHELSIDGHPFPFSLKKPNTEFRNNVKIGCLFESGDLVWSDPFPVECASFVRHINDSLRTPPRCYTIGVNITPGQGKQANSRIVTLCPYYNLVNLLPCKVSVCPHFSGIDEMSAVVLENGQQTDLHWWTFETKKCLCFRVVGEESTLWSGVIQINKIDSFQTIMRDSSDYTIKHFVNVDVSYRGGFHIAISEADSSFLPFCIENCINLPIYFHQSSLVGEHIFHSVKPNSCYLYALDEPTGSQSLVFSILDCRQKIDLNVVGETEVFLNQLFYIVHSPPGGDELVLEYNDHGQVVLAEKRLGNRRQLWRIDEKRIYNDIMTPKQYLGAHKSRNSWRVCVTTAVKQHWGFVGGSLRCEELKMAVRVDKGVVLLGGMGESSVTKCNVWSSTDRIVFSVGQQGDFSMKVTVVDYNDKPQPDSTDTFSLSLNLHNGIGISLINHLPEELIYSRLKGISLRLAKIGRFYDISLQVDRFQVDDQLREVTDSVILYFKRSHLPDVSLSCRFTCRSTVVFFEDFCLNLQKMYFILEERVLWKIIQFLTSKGTKDDHSLERGDQTKLSFRRLLVSMDKLVLSVHKSQLSQDLKKLKNSYGIKLINFDDAKIGLDPFLRTNIVRRFDRLQSEILNHYKAIMSKHAAKIFGYVDFLGNPLGLVNDFVTGMSDLTEGNVEGFIKSVTHGISNSAAKFTSSLSEAVAPTTFDSEHSFSRKQVMHSQRRVTMDHIVAGVESFGLGFWSGLTSLPSGVYRGAIKGGVTGVVKGLVKGAIGTVTKPLVGTLDLASSVASALERTSSRSTQQTPKPMRRARCCRGAILSAFSESSAFGQEILCSIIRQSGQFERFIAVERISRCDNCDHLMILSSHSVYLVKCYESSGFVISSDDVVTIHYADISSLRTMQRGRSYFVEINVSGENVYIACASLSCSCKVCHWLSFAKMQYEEEFEGFAISNYRL